MNNLNMIINLKVIRSLIEKKKYDEAIGFIMGISVGLIGDFPE